MEMSYKYSNSKRDLIIKIAELDYFWIQFYLINPVLKILTMLWNVIYGQEIHRRIFVFDDVIHRQ